MLKSRIKLVIAENELRTGKKVEHQQIASDLGITKNYFSNIVNGHVVLNNMEKAHKLARLLECKVDDLYIYSEEEQS